MINDLLAELYLFAYSFSIVTEQQESLTNLANKQHFDKLKSTQFFHLMQICLGFNKFAKLFSHQYHVIVNLPKVSSHQIFLLCGIYILARVHIFFRY